MNAHVTMTLNYFEANIFFWHTKNSNRWPTQKINCIADHSATVGTRFLAIFTKFSPGRFANVRQKEKRSTRKSKIFKLPSDGRLKSRGLGAPRFIRT